MRSLATSSARRLVRNKACVRERSSSRGAMVYGRRDDLDR